MSAVLHDVPRLQPKIEIRPFVVTEQLPLIAALMREHWQETEHDVVPEGPAPIAAAYAAIESQGGLAAFGAFAGEEMVGYVVMIIGAHHHYGFVFAQHDVLFVRREYRASGVGLRLIREAEADAIRRGARMMVWHAKPESALAKILQHRGYAVEDVVLRKSLPCQ